MELFPPFASSLGLLMRMRSVSAIEHAALVAMALLSYVLVSRAARHRRHGPAG